MTRSQKLFRILTVASGSSALGYKSLQIQPRHGISRRLARWPTITGIAHKRAAHPEQQQPRPRARCPPKMARGSSQSPGRHWRSQWWRARWRAGRKFCSRGREGVLVEGGQGRGRGRHRQAQAAGTGCEHGRWGTGGGAREYARVEGRRAEGAEAGARLWRGAEIATTGKYRQVLAGLPPHTKKNGLVQTTHGRVCTPGHSKDAQGFGAARR